MAKSLTRKNPVIYFLFTVFTAFLLFTGCKTTELREQIATLTEKQAFLEEEKDSLQRLVDLRNRRLDSLNRGMSELSSNYETLSEKASALESTAGRRGEQLRKATADSRELSENLEEKSTENESLQSEIAALEEKISGVNRRMVEIEQEKTTLEKEVAQKQERIEADSITGAQRPAPVPPEITGYNNITELGGGFGLGDVSVDYSKSVISLTNISAYQINNRFLAGVGYGAHFYNGGVLLPLYIDMRFTFNHLKVSPMIIADGGLMINPNDIAAVGVFINPSLGVRFPMKNNNSLHLSSGVLIHNTPTGRHTFVNLKLGLSLMKK